MYNIYIFYFSFSEFNGPLLGISFPAARINDDEGTIGGDTGRSSGFAIVMLPLKLILAEGL